MQGYGRRDSGADIGEEREGYRRARRERGADVGQERVVQTYGRRERGAADVG